MARFSPLVRAGWPVLPLSRDGSKTPLVSGYHGKDRKIADVETIKSWNRAWPDANPGIVLPDNVIGLDVDGPSHGVNGLETIAAFEEKFGPLPETGWVFHGHTEDGSPSPYGTRLYRIPDSMLDVYTPGSVVGNLSKVAGPGVDVIAPWIRYNLAPGAIHSSGEVYEFYPSPMPGIPWLPNPADLPELTPRQVKALLKKRGETKTLTPAAAPLTGKQRAGQLLAQTRALAALREGETLLIEGEQRGWQKGDGFFVLACGLVRLAKDRQKAKAAFVKAAEPFWDAERQWENAEAAVDAEAEEISDAYPVSVAQEPYVFTSVVIERHFAESEGTLTLRYRDDDRTFWLWSEKKARYEHLSEDEVLATVKKKLRDATEVYMLADGPEQRKVKLTQKISKEVTEHLKSLTLTSAFGAGALLPSVGGVPFRNGWLDVSTGELVPVGPERDVRWNVQADYEPDAECPEWIQFLKSLGWDEDTEEYRLLRQWMGYLLSGRKDLDRALLLIGPTRSGKGTIIRVCMALLGDGAVGTTLDSLTRNFGLQNFIGKGLATIGDARFGRNDKNLNGVLLSLTSNDPLPVDVKYGKPLSINLPVRLMVATNETPNFIEASDALAQRFESLVFDRSFVENPDLQLFNRLSGELPGIARWALEGLRDLEEVGKFSPTTKGRDLQKRMIQESAFVRMFVEERCELAPGHRVDNEKLYAEFALWAEQNRMPVYNSVRFHRELLDAFPGLVSNGSFRISGKVVRGKIGLKLA